MKLYRSFKSFAIALSALFLTAGLSAQTTGAPAKGKTAQSEKIEASQAASDEEIAKELNLTAEQKSAFKKADGEYWTKAKANKNSKREEMQRLRDERTRAKRAVLSPEQQVKFDAIQAKKEAKREKRQAQKAEQKAVKKEQKTAKKANKSENKAIKEELKRQ